MQFVRGLLGRPRPDATIAHDMVVLLDVDNTLLDNDQVRIRLEEDLSGVLGPEYAERFWEIYEDVREELDFVNFPETIERFGRECPDADCVSKVSAVLYGFSFEDFVYADSLAAIKHVSSFAVPVILSDGDQLFQRHKIRSAGLDTAVDGNILVYVHKEQELADIKRRFPAVHYVMVDDKPRIHAAMKRAMGAQLTTIMVCQGKYAHDPAHHEFPGADVTIEDIGELITLTAGELRSAASDRIEG